MAGKKELFKGTYLGMEKGKVMIRVGGQEGPPRGLIVSNLEIDGPALLKEKVRALVVGTEVEGETTWSQAKKPGDGKVWYLNSIAIVPALGEEAVRKLEEEVTAMVADVQAVQADLRKKSDRELLLFVADRLIEVQSLAQSIFGRVVEDGIQGGNGIMTLEHKIQTYLLMGYKFIQTLLPNVESSFKDLSSAIDVTLPQVIESAERIARENVHAERNIREAIAEEQAKAAQGAVPGIIG